MSLLNIVRAAVLLVIMLAWMAFATRESNGQPVDVDLIWAQIYQVPVAWVVFCGFLVGALVGYALVVTKVVELHGRIRTLKRSSNQLEGELTTLRNLPLEEAEEHESGSESVA